MVFDVQGSGSREQVPRGFSASRAVLNASSCRYRSGSGEVMSRYRTKVRSSARGRVLEIGAQDIADVAGHRQVSFLALVNPSEQVRAEKATRWAHLPHVEIVDAEPEFLPFPGEAFDVVVCTFSLCRATEPQRVLRDIRRILRPAGHFLFLEHSRTSADIDEGGTHVPAPRKGTLCGSGPDVAQIVHRSGFVLQRFEVTCPAEVSALRESLVQGVAAPPSPQYERELRWLSGA